MHPVTRIEIIVNSVGRTKVIEALKQGNVDSYYVIRDVVGKDREGRVSDDMDFVSGDLSDVYIISYCMADKVKSVVELIRLVLNKYGGACYLSDATEIRSTRCVAKL
ncbi:MAG: P-II family nitrogen regulator [Leptolyngbyaceae bacterium]|nr:P-II family nitrogen regulator [Leptolyngbyaceae bacterium]